MKYRIIKKKKDICHYQYVIKLLKDGKGGRITVKLALIKPKTYAVKIQKGEYVKKRVSKISKELTFNDFEKHINDIKNTLISKDQTSFKSA